MPGITGLKFHEDLMDVELDDGRTVSVPVAWYPRLARAKKSQLKHYQISPAGYGIHWPDIDEDLSVMGFLFPSMNTKLEHI
jgi:hypothetical protein